MATNRANATFSEISAWPDLKAGQPDRAYQYVEQALALARAAGDRVAEKLLLERQGLVEVAHGNLSETLRLLNEALTLARTLGNRQQEADLLWYLALGQAGNRQTESRRWATGRQR